MSWLKVNPNLTKMDILVQLFPYGKTIAGMRRASDHGHVLMDSTATRVRRHTVDPLPWSPSSLVTVAPGEGCPGRADVGDPCTLFQTQAAQTVLQSREGPATPRMAVLLGLIGVGMSGYSSRQLTLHYKPSSHLFR